MRSLSVVLVAVVLASCSPAAGTPEAPTLPATAVQPTATLAAEAVRRPSAAGRYYTDDPQMLAAQVDALLAEAEVREVGAAPMALVVPHAGYVYSGHVAAQAYKQIDGIQYEAIIVVGVNHQDPSFRQVSVWAEGGFETPLGVARVDEALAAELLAADEHLVFERDVHLREHSVEVQVPFLQRIYGESLRFVPIVIGEPSEENCRALADAIVKVVQGRRALVLASADLSHYPAYDDALRSDGAILQAIVSMDPERLSATRDEMMALQIPNLATCSCGQGPVTTAMIAAGALGASQAALLRYANSGDTPFEERDQVVGYGAVMFWNGADMAPEPASWAKPAELLPIAPLSGQEREELLELARRTLERYLTLGDAPIVRPDEPGLWQERASFVTLRQEGELRGCIGELVGTRPLYLSVQWAALSAAVADRRFPPVAADELPNLSIEISALTPLQEVQDVSTIQIGEHGLLVVQGGKRGVLLPQVAVNEGWDRDAFLQAVCRKAALAEDCWQTEDSELYSFEAEVFGKG